MIKYCLRKWEENKEKLEKSLLEDKDLNSCGYKHLVEKVVEVILNNGEVETWDVGGITEINNGDYHGIFGILLYLIPKDTYQPSECEYLMTYVNYGSCSGCDTLQAIQDYGKDEITEDQLKEFMFLCEYLVCCMIKPYNYGWREEEEFLPVEENNG